MNDTMNIDEPARAHFHRGQDFYSLSRHFELCQSDLISVGTHKYIYEGPLSLDMQTMIEMRLYYGQKWTVREEKIKMKTPFSRPREE